METRIKWWARLSNWFKPQPEVLPVGRRHPRVKRRVRRTPDFADHGTAFGLDMSLQNSADQAAKKTRAKR